MMNTLKKIYGTLALLLLCAVAWGQTVTDPTKIPTVGICNLTKGITVTEPIVLTGNLTIRHTGTSDGWITIKNGGSKQSGKSYTLDQMFLVPDGKTLTIEGGSSKKQIIIDGGANFTVDDGFQNLADPASGFTAGSGTKKLYEACIKSQGKVVLRNVVLQNGDFAHNHGGLLRLFGPSGTTEIYNCVFKKARSHQGCGISVNSNDESPTSSEKITITIEGSTFKQCYLLKYPDGKDQSGAVIRFNGSWCGHLNMTNCVMENNYTAGDVNSLQWNAIGNGTLEPKCTMIGCTFRNNVAAGNGATMLIEGTISFEDAVTKVYNNEAKGFGGGIWVNGYSGGVKLNPRTEPIDINLNEWLEVYNNTAGRQGGGVVFQFTSGSTLPQGTELNVNLSGAKIYENTSTGNGGGLYITNSTTVGPADEINPETGKKYQNFIIKVNLNGSEIYSNTSGDFGGGIYVESVDADGNGVKLEDFSVNLNTGKVYGNTAAESGGGIYVKNADVSVGKDEQEVFSVTGNQSIKSGGGLYVYSGNLLVRNIHLEDNHATGDKGQGGGIRMYTESSTVSMELHKGTIINNTAQMNGGGVSIENGHLEVHDILLDNNEALNGPGGAIRIYTSGGGTASISINNGTITNNTAKTNGGGVSILRGDFSIENGTITSNKATTNGGGVYVENGDFTVTGNAQIESNSTPQNGGGIAVTEGGNVIITGEVSVRNNTATLGGGGIYVSDGEVTIAKGDISRNTSSGDGGGLLVESTTPKTLTFDGGVFSWNRARCGGGIATEGPVNLSLSATVQNNYATNGGGIYLSKEAEMTFSDGLIRGNHANGTSDLPTAYQGTGATLQGVGGGVFLDSNTKLKFSLTQAFGIYSNVAEFAADDIFANGVSTNVDLPAVANMTLKDFDVPTNILYWMEDYKNGDTRYGTGVATDMAGTGVATDIETAQSYRYQEALRDYKELRHLIGKTVTGDLSDFDEKYLCLALGYELVYLTLIKEGLDFGDDATFVFSYKKEGDTDFTPYQKIIVTGVKDPSKQNSVWESIALPEGYWKIEESDWSWEYSDTPEYSYYNKDGSVLDDVNVDVDVDAEGDPYIKVENGVKTVKLTRDGVNAIKVKNTKIPVTDPAQYVRSFDFHKLNIMNPVE